MTTNDDVRDKILCLNNKTEIEISNCYLMNYIKIIH